MSGNLDKILEGIKNRTAEDIKKIDREQRKKHDAVMNRRAFDM